MVETIHITPPDLGLQSDPLLYGVAQALEQLFPLDEASGTPASQFARVFIPLPQDDVGAG